MYTWVNKALVVRAGVVSRRVGVYCMYWTTARHKPLSLALPICTLTDGPEWLIDALTCHSNNKTGLNTRAAALRAAYDGHTVSE